MQPSSQMVLSAPRKPRIRNIWVGKMAEKVKALAVKPDNLSSTRAMHTMEGEN